jgi:RNA polymerase sigma-70 factor (ECF subfamily)
MQPDTTHPSLLGQMRDPADARAWREFDRRYGDLIVGFARSCGLQLSDAEDVRQLVMMNLSQSMPGFEYDPQRGRFRSYLARVVRNAIQRHISRHGRPMSALDTDVLAFITEDESVALDRQWERQWRRHHCRRALTELRESTEPRHAAVFDRLLAGESPADIANDYGLTQEGVRKVKQRMKDRLREIVTRQIREEERSI